MRFGRALLCGSMVAGRVVVEIDVDVEVDLDVAAAVGVVVVVAFVAAAGLLESLALSDRDKFEQYD